MLESLNPLNWVRSTQNWFAKTERSSGFRPYLIFLLIDVPLCIVLLYFFGKDAAIARFVEMNLYFSIFGFILIFFIKAIQDPDFCRSERHVENVKRIEAAEQKGDRMLKRVFPTTEALPEPNKGTLTENGAPPTDGAS